MSKDTLVNDQLENSGQSDVFVSNDPAVDELPRERRRRSSKAQGGESRRFLKGVDPHLVSLVAVTSPEAEQYRTICSRLEQMHKESSLSVIAVSSPLVGDGKTMTAMNIAGTLTQFPDTRVLLVDLDIRRPAIARYLGIPVGHSPGVIGFIEEQELILNEVVSEYAPFQLAVLPAGGVSRTPHKILKSRRLATLFQEARTHYDYVIVDLPPILFSDCRLVEHLIDGVVLVVSAHRTPRKLVEESLNVLHPNKVSGLILNNDDRPLFGYYSYYSDYYYARPFADERTQAAQNGSVNRKRFFSNLCARSTSLWSRLRVCLEGNGKS
jgi:capsular exopolysaccharide synthesis family protein